MSYKHGDPLIKESFLFRLASHLTFYPIVCIAQLVNMVLYSTSFENTEKLRRFRGRAILVSNHTTFLDPVKMSWTMLPFRTWHTLLEKTVEAPFLGVFTRLLGGLPLPPGGRGIEKIIESSEAAFKQFHFIHFYPEGECYIYNQRIASFKSGAFLVAARLKIPVFPVVTIFSEGAFKPGTFLARKFPKEKAVVLDPVYPEKYIRYNDDGSIDLNSIKEFAGAVHVIMQNEIEARHEKNYRDGTQAYCKGKMPRLKGIN
jgi:1-acyl-sn-glycerol-3-phosphate acyltransferase